MVHLKSKQEIEIMRQAALIVSRTLGIIAEYIKPGITPFQLDKLAEDYILSQNALPGFKGLYDFPNTLCISINEQVVHGIPTNYEIREGDIVSVDCGSKFEGFYGDQAYTFAIGTVLPEIKKLLKISYESLLLGIEQCTTRNRIGDIGYAIQTYCEKYGYGVVRSLVGHGVGKKMHEEPEIPNFGRKNSGTKIKNGMVLAIEPMINLGTHEVLQLEDKWTIITKDKKPSVHFEHDVAIVDGKPDVLSTFKFVENAIKKNQYVDSSCY